MGQPPPAHPYSSPLETREEPDIPHRTPPTDRGSLFPAGAIQPGEIAVCGRALVETGTEAGERRLWLFGELDLASARSLDVHQLVPLAEASARMLIDLTGLSQVDGLAIRVLLRRQRLARFQGVQVLIRLAPHQAAHVV